MIPTLFCAFVTADEAVEATRLLRGRGIDQLEAYTPFAVPELEAMLGKRSRVPIAAFIGGALGGLLAFAIIYYCNAYDYALNVGGRPLDSLPSDIPIIFETTVLFAALTTFLAFLVRSGLPRLAHPLFEVEGFDRVSVDRYWIGIDIGASSPDAIEKIVHELAPHAVVRKQAA